MVSLRPDNMVSLVKEEDTTVVAIDNRYYVLHESLRGSYELRLNERITRSAESGWFASHACLGGSQVMSLGNKLVVTDFGRTKQTVFAVDPPFSRPAVGIIRGKVYVLEVCGQTRRYKYASLDPKEWVDLIKPKWEYVLGHTTYEDNTSMAPHTGHVLGDELYISRLGMPGLIFYPETGILKLDPTLDGFHFNEFSCVMGDSIYSICPRSWNSKELRLFGYNARTSKVWEEVRDMKLDVKDVKDFPAWGRLMKYKRGLLYIFREAMSSKIKGIGMNVYQGEDDIISGHVVWANTIYSADHYYFINHALTIDL